MPGRKLTNISSRNSMSLPYLPGRPSRRLMFPRLAKIAHDWALLLTQVFYCSKALLLNRDDGHQRRLLTLLIENKTFATFLMLHALKSTYLNRHEIWYRRLGEILLFSFAYVSYFSFCYCFKNPSFLSFV